MPVNRTQQRRLASRTLAKRLLKELIEDQSDPFICYRQLYTVWCGNNSAVQELRPLFRIPGIEPDGQLSMTAELKTQVRAVAAEILSTFSESK